MSKQSTYKLKGAVSLVVSSIKGIEMDYTKGNLRKAIIMLAIPMILEMSMESVFALVDLFFVGHLPNSTHTIQTVSLTESVLSIIYSIAFGISMAATAIVARRVGEKNKDGAAHAAMQTIWLAIIVAIVIGVTGFAFAADMLRVLGAEQQTIT